MTHSPAPDRRSVLGRIKSPRDVSRLDISELITLSGEVRQTIIEVCSRNGGHLAPSLGVVELTLALFKAFDLERDRLIWDVGHQAYAHKILTGRLDRFPTLRKLGGISGFPRLVESPYDHFGVGHSSTSISAALGMAMGRDLDQRRSKVVAVIGDGSISTGLAFEGLNQAGDMGRDLVVVLNDNEMSISRNVGAMSAFLSRQLSSHWVRRFKKETENWLNQVPRIGKDLVKYARRSEEVFKSFFTPGMLFEAFKFNYMGPFDGHNIEGLIDVFSQVRNLHGPVLVHVMTIKGKGYQPAVQDPTHFHGVGCFEMETGEAIKSSGCNPPSYTEVFGRTLCRLAESDPKITAITAAMPEGTGLNDFAKRFPERFVDVGICEQHAVTFAAGLATQGYRPVVAIYSTFLQRSYDQIVHDVCLQNLPVTFCLDRAGLVGEDGATHHGAFDLSYLRHIPNMVVMAPKDEAELMHMLHTAVEHPGPAAVRYPRGAGLGVGLPERPQTLEIGRGELLRDGTDAVVIAVGSTVWPALKASLALQTDGLADVAVFNARFVRPLPEAQLLELSSRFKRIILAEENVLAGGFGSAVLELLTDREALDGQRIRRLGLPDDFVEHGKQVELRTLTGLDEVGIRAALRELLGV